MTFTTPLMGPEQPSVWAGSQRIKMHKWSHKEGSAWRAQLVEQEKESVSRAVCFFLQAQT